MKKYYTYVIKSEEGYRYTGMTEGLEGRLNQHNNGELSFWTKRGSGWRIIYSEEFSDKKPAMKREKWLKTGVGRDFLKRNVKEY